MHSVQLSVIFMNMLESFANLQVWVKSRLDLCVVPDVLQVISLN